MIKINDGTQTKRIAGKAGDRTPQTGLKRDRAIYVAVGGETSIDLSLLSPAISYMPGMNQLTVKRSSVGGLISGYSFYERSTSTIGFSTALVAGEWVEVIKEVQISGIQAATLRPDLYSVTATNGQTLVAADFSWPYNLNPTKGVGGCEVYLHGILQTRGVDYTEVNLGTPNTNQIQFVDALSGGENVIVKPTYQVIDQSAAASTFYGQQIIGIQSGLLSSSQPFVDTSVLISAPYTTIINRSKIPDLSKDLKASLGIDRVIIQQLVEKLNEYGPNGERVYSVLGDDNNLVRLVGTWLNSVDSNGARAAFPSSAGVSTNYIEITFYGTGLNLLYILYSNAHDVRVSIDGGAEGANIASGSYVFSGQLVRGSAANHVLNIVSGLSLGVHTAKIRFSASADVNLFGFETINSNSSGLVNFNKGSAYIGGLKYDLASASSINYRSVVTGTKGGRVVSYLKQDGTIGQSWQAVNALPAYTTSTDHTNEEIAAIYYVREFGVGRTDDFSRSAVTTFAAAASTLAFTLDDGTTNLVASYGDFVSGLQREAFAVRANGTTQFLTLTFVGTGIDIELFTDATTRQFDTITIDGITAASNVSKTANTLPEIRKIASNLPYGTHVVKFSVSGTQTSPAIGKFIIYQPKKPLVPDGCIEIADYNVLADYKLNVGSNGSLYGLDNIADGVIRKNQMRELTFAGTTYSAATMSVSNTIGGIAIDSTAVNNTISYTFFGTGFDVRYLDNTDGANVTVTIDGLTATATNYPSMTLTAYGRGSYNTSTGTLSQTYTSQSPGGGLAIRGLSLGIHTVKFTHASGSVMRINSIDIVTPMHSPRYNQRSLQNVPVVGSCAISDSRSFSWIKDSLPIKKSWVYAAGISLGPTTTLTVPSPCPDLSCTIKTSGGPLQINYSINVSNSGNQTVAAFIYVDGVQVGTEKNVYISTINSTWTINDSILLPVDSGFHKVDVYWSTSGGTATAMTNRRNLSVREV